MLILLPPSETKRPDGAGAPLAVASLRFPSLAPVRERAISALETLSADPDAAARVLKLSERQRGEIAVNATLRTSPTMPAIDRYTGVLYDALSSETLDAASRAWLGEHVVIHSAPFGPVGALDAIPAYRLAAGTSVPGLGAQRRLWAAPVTDALAASESGFILDLRSAAYVALGPVPVDTPSMTPRLVTEGADGAVRALNHFNKHAKGALIRCLAQARPVIDSASAFVAWAGDAGVELREGPGGWDLVA